MNKEDYCSQKGENRFYVYIHRRLSDNKPFYVGKGTRNRAWRTGGRSKHWFNTVNKHGYYIEVIFDGLTDLEAYQVEIDTILEFQYFQYPLVNLTSGGEGLCGYKPTPEHIENGKIARLNSEKWRDGIEKMKKALTGRNLTEEHRNNISKGTIGKVLSDEQKENLSRIKKSDPVAMSHILKLVESRRDTNVYKFSHVDGEIFTGNRRDFHLLTGIPKKEINKLFSKKNKIECL